MKLLKKINFLVFSTIFFIYFAAQSADTDKKFKDIQKRKDAKCLAILVAKMQLPLAHSTEKESDDPHAASRVTRKNGSRTEEHEHFYEHDHEQIFGQKGISISGQASSTFFHTKIYEAYVNVTEQESRRLPKVKNFLVKDKDGTYKVSSTKDALKIKINMLIPGNEGVVTCLQNLFPSSFKLTDYNECDSEILIKAFAAIKESQKK